MFRNMLASFPEPSEELDGMLYNNYYIRVADGYEVVSYKGEGLDFVIDCPDLSRVVTDEFFANKWH